MMSSEESSILVWCWHDLQTNVAQLRVVRVDTGKEVHLSDGVFLLRISTDENGAMKRCFVRHLGSGREVHLQSGASLRTFVEACLLNETAPEDISSTPESPPEASSEADSDMSVPGSEASPPEKSTGDTNT